MNKVSQTKNNKGWSTIGLVVFLMLAGAVIGLAISNYKHQRCLGGHKYINTSVYCHDQTVIKKHGYAETVSVLTKYIEQETKAGNIERASIYFRDLENGPVFGINESMEFAPASLLKLPLALVYMSYAEKDPKILESKLTLRGGGETFGQAFTPTEEIAPGKEYSVEELLKRMLVFSDNRASELLFANLEAQGKKDLIRQTYLELGILAPDDAFDEVISTRRYASIFRALYNLSYLHPEFSEKVLGWMAESKFKQGIAGAVPADVKISHKFGERVSGDSTKQLHDCGIIYFPENPYLLCVMTAGEDWQKLSQTIQKVSQIVYQEVESRKIE